MREERHVSRRAFLTGAEPSRHHISSAVVFALPARWDEIRKHLEKMPGVEVHAGDGSRLVVTIEGPTTGTLGETLTRISMLDGVISASMVFEHAEEQEDVGS